MVEQRTSNEVVTVNMDFAYAVVRRSDWEEILSRERWYYVIWACRTWGDYRDLGPNPFDELMRSASAAAGDPADDQPFPTNPPFAPDGETPWNRWENLETATAEFFASLGGAVDLSGLVQSEGSSSWVYPDDLDGVISKLKSRGFKVTDDWFRDD